MNAISHHLTCIAKIPFTIISKIWVTAKKVYRMMRLYFHGNPYQRSAEDQAKIDAIMAKFLPRVPQQPLPAEEAGPIKLLTPRMHTDLHDPIQKFQVICKQITTTLFTSATTPQLCNDYNLQAVERITDLISENIGELAKNIPLSKLLDRLLCYFQKETGQYQFAFLHKHSLFKNEKEKLDRAKRTIYDYYHRDELEEGQYIPNKAEKINAKEEIKDITFKGFLILKNEIYYNAYKEELAQGKSVDIADCIANEKCRDALEEWGLKGQNLPQELKEKSQNLYLEQCFLDSFFHQSKGTKGVQATLSSSNPVKNMFDYMMHVHIPQLAKQITNQMMDYSKSLIAPLVEEGFLGSKFLEPEFVENVFITSLTPKIAEAIKKAILPQEIENLLVKKVYPALFQNLLINFFKILIKEHWNRMESLFYSYQVNRDQREVLFKVIREKIFNHVKNHYADFLIDPDFFDETIQKVIKNLLSNHFFVKMLLKNGNGSDAFNDLAFLFQELIDVPEEQEKLDKEIKAVIYSMISEKCTKYADQNQLNHFVDDLDSLIAHIKSHLTRLKKNKEETGGYFDIFDIKDGIQNAWEPFPEIINDKFGDIALNIFEFSNFAPNLFYIAKGGPLKSLLNLFTSKEKTDQKLDPLIINKVKNVINQNASTGIKPFTSVDKLFKLMVKNLKMTWFNDDKAYPDPEKVMRLIKPKSEPKLNLNLAQEFDLISKLLFELIMIQTPDLLKWEVKQIVGEDPSSLNELLNKVHQAFFGNMVVNLNRFEKITKILFKTLNNRESYQNLIG